jgi:hypothetical protein
VLRAVPHGGHECQSHVMNNDVEIGIDKEPATGKWRHSDFQVLIGKLYRRNK